MQSLCQSTHLYGRRLVLEWAQSAEEDVEQLRKRTAERFPVGKQILNFTTTYSLSTFDYSDHVI